MELTTDVADLDGTYVLLRIDHEDSGWSDNDVIDVGSAARDESIVEHLNSRSARKNLRDSNLALGADLPRRVTLTSVVRISGEGGEDSSGDPQATHLATRPVESQYACTPAANGSPHSAHEAERRMFISLVIRASRTLAIGTESPGLERRTRQRFIAGTGRYLCCSAMRASTFEYRSVQNFVRLGSR